MEDDDISLLSSKLGTQKHWEDSYELELQNFKQTGDCGEIWFGERCQNRITRWLKVKDDVKKDDRVIELGCGNAALLVKLAEYGFTCLSGVDYCQSAIDLAKQVTKAADHEHIKLQVCDILSSEKPEILNQKYRVCVDKGTFDAISLMPDASVRRVYCDRVADLLMDDGYFMITSCNWTLDELKSLFVKHFVFHSEIPSPKFQFGNKTGQTVSSLIFTKLKSKH